MKKYFAVAVSFWLVGFLTGRVDGESTAPVVVELNGIASFFGVQQAFFELRLPVGGTFGLSPGETKHGITLLAIDSSAMRVLIENGGQQQSLSLSSAPALTETMLSADSNESAGGLDETGKVAINPNLPGNPGWGTLPAETVGGAISPGEKFSAALNGPNPALRLKDQAGTDWYQEAMSIEESRRNTAEAVLAGQMTPWPLTPLTPDGTPANLISKDGLFWNHMPGFLNRSMTGDVSAISYGK